MFLFATYFDLGATFNADTLDIAGTIFADLASYVSLLVGVIIVLAFITRLIKSFR